MRYSRVKYNSLPVEERLRRMELIAQCYASYLNCEDWKESPFLDCTRHWEEFEESLKESLKECETNE